MATKVKMLSKVHNTEFRAELKGKVPKAGETVEVSKERADWLVSKNYAQVVSAKGEVEANPGYGSDEDVKKATREASAQYGEGNTLDATGESDAPGEDDETKAKKSASKKTK